MELRVGVHTDDALLATMISFMVADEDYLFLQIGELSELFNFKKQTVTAYVFKEHALLG